MLIFSTGKNHYLVIYFRLRVKDWGLTVGIVSSLFLVETNTLVITLVNNVNYQLICD